jgi:hypothetical protein
VQKLFIVAAALQFAIAAAIAQPASLSGNQSLSLDQQGKISKMITNQTPQPLINVNFSVAIDGVVPSSITLQRLPAEAEKVAP